MESSPSTYITSLVYRLKSSLYGLKQSARCWNAMMDAYLKESGYKQNAADPCVYIKTENVKGENVIVLIGVYVDDSIEFLKAEKGRISKRFEMDDRGEIDFILGMKIKRDRVNRVLTIDQEAYLKEVLE